MTPEEYDRFYSRSVEGYAQERARNLDAPIEEQRAEATRQFEQLLPQGRDTAGQRLWTLVDDASRSAGVLWVSVNEARHSAFIFEIWIEPDRRGQGFGRRAMQLLEEELRPLGVRRISLNVFADNQVAQGLYRSMGYQVTNFNMTKRLD